MTTPFRIQLVAAILFTTVSLTLRAESISGSYSNDCTVIAKLWDLSGNYFENNGMETEAITLNMDAAGNVTGTGHFDLTDSYDGIHLDGNFNVIGKVSSAGSVTRVKLTLNLTSGSGDVQGYYVTFQATLKENFEIDSDNRMLIGNSSGKLKLTVPDFGKSKTVPVPSSPANIDLPPEVDGAWGLFVNMAPNGAKYGGTSSLQLSNGKTLNLAVSGSYSAKTDLSKISLKSSDSTRPATLSVVGRCIGDELSILSLKGKALGQNIQLAK